MIKQTYSLGLLSLIIVFLAGCAGEVPEEGEAAPAAGEEAAPVVPDEEAIPLTPEAVFQECMAKCTPEYEEKVRRLFAPDEEINPKDVEYSINSCKRTCHRRKADYSGNPADCDPILSFPSNPFYVTIEDFEWCIKIVIEVSKDSLACERLSSLNELCAVAVLRGPGLDENECNEYKRDRQVECYLVAADTLRDPTICDRIDNTNRAYKICKIVASTPR